MKPGCRGRINDNDHLLNENIPPHTYIYMKKRKRKTEREPAREREEKGNTEKDTERERERRKDKQREIYREGVRERERERKKERKKEDDDSKRNSFPNLVFESSCLISELESPNFQYWKLVAIVSFDSGISNVH